MSQHRVEDESKSVLAIIEPAPDMLVASRLRISGTCATTGVLKVVARQTYYPAIASGSWRIEEDLQDFGSTVIQITATQGTRSETRHVYIQDYSQLPQITKPENGSFFSSSLRVEGLALSGATVTVRDPRQGALGTTTVGSFGHWALDITPADGEVSITATQNISTGTPDPSLPVRFTMAVATPSITAPDAGSLQPQVFSVSGSGGRPGSEVRIFLDMTQNMVGKSSTLTGSSWTASVSLDPGHVSLVAQQFYGGVGSTRSAPHALKIQPPVLTPIKVEHPTITTAEFSGDGYSGATVQITIVSGPAATPPPLVVVSGGKWQTASANWPFGSYLLSAVQKVSDNAGGWIESLPLRFKVDYAFPAPSDVTHTEVYTPVFSGRGVNGATIKLFAADCLTPIARDVRVSNNQWSSTALEAWGPVWKRGIHIQQILVEECAWVDYEVSIPPLAPDSVTVVENDQSPRISGNCWPGAVVILEYNNDFVKHRTTVTGATWTFRRDLPFTPDVTHSFSVTQTFASQTSVPATGSFTVRRAMLKPLISVPAEGAEVSSNTTISGKNGMSGARMSVWDEQMGDELNSKQLTSDGDWSIELVNLKYRVYSLTARQTLDTSGPVHSDIRVCNVVLLPPVLLTPAEGRDLPRHSILSGTGWPGARVSVWLQGRDEPLLDEVSVNAAGQWSGQVSLNLVGSHRLRLRQTFADQVSKDLLRDVRVVPSTPVIESPIKDAAIGSAVVISGFGYPGDTVTVKLAGGGATLGSGPVLEDRTWSLSANIDHPGGPGALTVEAASGDFVSAVSAPQAVQINTWLPVINAPSAGRWVALPVTFAGTGKAGVGQVVSWFNPDVIWAADLAVSNGQWQGAAAQPLAPGGNWCRFRQTFAAGTDPASASDWTESQRFEVLPLPPSS
ncbi:hypothetical protein [Pseudomonas sp. PB106]|uniref:hypothetical protein n=1 Tax=Pseudomonas sp. PB106 TaxID=2494699 RepID=UPI00131C9FC7|nr:hypothetical protein [Pseudomonas sp. PB106]KAE9639222.1 hypothetical protein EJA71_25750 [Pseudomonas sp. PB106]